MKTSEFKNLLKAYLANNPKGTRELAGKFEVAVSTVNSWANGTARPNPRIAQQVVNHLKSMS